MRTIGVIGGMSAESTALYYARMNAETRRRLGGLHSAKTIIWSVDFAEIADLQETGAWDEAGAILGVAAARLEAAGADVILLATNTMHRVVGQIEAATALPVLHIADATGERVARAGAKRPGLLATAFTMEADFYVGRLRERFGLDVLVPQAEDRALIHRIIYDELCRGEVTEKSRRAFEGIAAALVRAGGDGLILGCTEVGLLLDQGNVAVPVFDTVAIHVEAAVDFALSDVVAIGQAAE